jgi:hypothetical protein
MSREENRLRVIESRVMRRIFDVREIGTEWCGMFCSALHDCYVRQKLT